MPRLDFWPSPQQEFLLTAALADNEAAIHAWQVWQSRETIEATDQGSRRLMPLVYFNLARLGVNEPSMASLKETYIRTRSVNRLWLIHLSRLLELFASQEIPTLLFKGAALTLQVYHDLGLRPMADVDLAVPHHCAERAMNALKDNGWVSESWLPERYLSPELVAAVQFQDRHGVQFDLHFSPFHDYAPFFRNRLAWTTVAPLWSAATPLSVGEFSTLALSATDHLLHTLEHGARADIVPPIRWVADATWLLRGEAPIAWDRFVAQAKSLHLSLVASRTLAYLRDRHGADVPAAVLSALGRCPSALEVLEYSSRRDKLRRWIALRKCWALYVTEHPDRQLLMLIFGFVDFLKVRWSARNSVELLWLALKHFLFLSRRS
jgi:hypothetical protein